MNPEVVPPLVVDAPPVLPPPVVLPVVGDPEVVAPPVDPPPVVDPAVGADPVVALPVVVDVVVPAPVPVLVVVPTPIPPVVVVVPFPLVVAPIPVVVPVVPFVLVLPVVPLELAAVLPSEEVVAAPLEDPPPMPLELAVVAEPELDPPLAPTGTFDAEHALAMRAQIENDKRTKRIMWGFPSERREALPRNHTRGRRGSDSSCPMTLEAGNLPRPRGSEILLRMRMAPWIALATLFVAATGQAQQDPAHDHYLAGVADYKAGRYAEAIGEFQTADQIRPSPVLSFNIAQCYEKMADLQSARTAYQEYLVRAPNAPDRTAVEATIASIDKRLLEKGNDSVVLVPSTQISQTQEKGQPYWISATILGVGAAGIITGVILNVIANSNASSLTNGTLHKRADAQSYYDNANNAWTGAAISYGVGGGLLAIGAGLLTYQLLQQPPPPAAAVTVQ